MTVALALVLLLAVSSMRQGGTKRAVRIPYAIASVASLLAVTFFAGACSPQTEESARQLILQTNWAPQPEDGGFYHAQRTGMFEEKGISMKVRPASAGMNIYTTVAAGDADFGISVLAKVLVAVDRGLPLKVISSYRPASLRVLLAHAEDPVESFEDLDGRLIKARGEDLWLKYLISEYDLDLRILPHDFGIGQFVARKDLIQQGLLTSEPFTLREKGVPVKVLELKEAGWKNMEVLFCREELLEADPDLVSQVASICAEGWRGFLSEASAETLLFLAEENPARSIESMRWAKEILASKYKAALEEGEDWLGPVDLEAAQGFAESLKEMGALSEGFELESSFWSD